MNPMSKKCFGGRRGGWDTISSSSEVEFLYVHTLLAKHDDKNRSNRERHMDLM
jgi:hypothetical protein